MTATTLYLTTQQYRVFGKYIGIRGIWMNRRNKVRRFDVASILETAFENNVWKGENHHFGLFFTGDNAYCINKVLAIRARHEESAPHVFYSFHEESIEEKVTLEFPYDGMTRQPRKHHLLIERDTLKVSEVDPLFDEVPIVMKTDLVVEDNQKCIEEFIPNKRERDRTHIHYDIIKDSITMTLSRTKNGEEAILHTRVFVVANTPFDRKDTYRATVNANTLHTVLKIFPEKTKVSFIFSHDRMILTGKLSTEEGEQSQVEAVIALMKG